MAELVLARHPPEIVMMDTIVVEPRYWVRWAGEEGEEDGYWAGGASNERLVMKQTYRRARNREDICRVRHLMACLPTLPLELALYVSDWLIHPGFPTCYSCLNAKSKLWECTLERAPKYLFPRVLFLCSNDMEFEYERLEKQQKREEKEAARAAAREIKRSGVELWAMKVRSTYGAKRKPD